MEVLKIFQIIEKNINQICSRRKAGHTVSFSTHLNSNHKYEVLAQSYAVVFAGCTSVFNFTIYSEQKVQLNTSLLLQHFGTIFN